MSVSSSEVVTTASQNAAADQDWEQPRYSRRDTLLTMLGVLLVMLLGSLDQTIVGTAMPRVIADLHGFNEYTWVTTAYLLTSTVMVPIYGKLSDQFGRKGIFLFGLVIFLAGSALSGAAQSMTELIAFRAFQGIGAAALLPIAIAVVGDLFSPRERGKWQGVTGGVFGIAAVIGPLAGGWITQYSSWRWIFYVNVPIGIVAFFVLLFLMPTLRGRGAKSAIDYIGAMLLVIGTVPLLLGFTWAGGQYAWLSAQIISLFAVSLVGFVSFILYEAWLARHGGQPIINPNLFKNSIFTVSSIVTFIFGMALFGCVFFIPLFVQGVVGASVSNSGLVLTPLMLTLVAGSIVSGLLVSRFGKYKWLAIMGTVVTVAGMYMLVRLNVNSTNTDVVWAMLVLGVGLGFGMSLYTLIVQNALPRRIGETTSALTFFRSIGGTIALAAMGSVMNSAYLPAFTSKLGQSLAGFPLPAALKATLLSQFASLFNNPQILLSPGALTQVHAKAAQQGPQGIALLNAALEAVKTGLAQGLQDVFVFSLIASILGVVAVLFLKEIEVRGKRKQVDASTENIEEETAEPSFAAML
ncbi:MAG TPA: MDR family MFS transporter [Ktedonobacteraceae bacterium]|nr:MDR family MFS transporter [Ktedonobacteraceae bacterium]